MKHVKSVWRDWFKANLEESEEMNEELTKKRREMHTI